MKLATVRSTIRAATFMLLTLSVVEASAEYFVRPVTNFLPGSLIDGLDVNGATSGSVGFTDAARAGRSSVDLETGEMKLYAGATGTNNTIIASGVMGETVTFRDGAGTSVDFSFGFDAEVEFTRISETLNSPAIQVDAAFAVFAAGLVDHTNWFGNALQNDPTDIAPLIFEREVMSFGAYADELNIGETFTDSANIFLEGAVNLGSNNESYDVFYLANLSGAPSDVLGSYILDGENTATADIAFLSNVNAFSSSGAFLGLPNDPTISAVPLPASAWLFGSALIGLLRIKRKS